MVFANPRRDAEEGETILCVIQSVLRIQHVQCGLGYLVGLRGRTLILLGP